jgi:predicted phage terminase large subunit-like protein
MIQILETVLINRMMKDRAVRIAITKDSFFYFFHFYYCHYVKYRTADFQKEIIHYLEKSSTEYLYLTAFRGSGKSTMVTTSYPIWAILGKQQKKFCIIFCQTRIQAKQHMMNIKQELENNELLKKDLGPFQEQSDEWGSYSLVFNNHGARITVASTEQSIRGLRHHEHRPDLIICDDVEDVQSTKTREGRDKTYNWLRGEVMPTGDRNTRLIVVGNLLHEDSMLMRIKEDIKLEKANGVYKEYPLLNRDGVCLWLGKYPTSSDIELEKKKVASEVLWQREYLLHIMPTEDQVILREWINYYDVMPSKENLRSIRIGVDLAISEKETADYTAMVTGWVYTEWSSRDTKVFIDPIVINKRMNFPDTVEKCKELHRTLSVIKRPDFAIEVVAYQSSLPQTLAQQGLSVRSIKIGSQDKRSRLVIASHLIKSGKVLFPRKGCELLIGQMVNFGVEKYDDLADAFTALIIDIIDTPSKRGPSIDYIDTRDLFGW